MSDAVSFRSASNEVCACLLETGSRQVEIVERCVRCGLCMDSDAYADALARALAEAALATTQAPSCSLCGVPLATGDCRHIIRRDGQVTMSESAWERMCSELAELRNLAADLEEAAPDPSGSPGETL